MSKFEKKFGKYAIPNLTLILIICYAVGYILMIFKSDILMYLTLNPYLILKGQVWRLFTWVLVPPSSFDIFTIIMLLFYYNIGTALERTWGDYRYNVYIFSGILFTVIGSFLCMGYLYLCGNSELEIMVQFLGNSLFFSTYFINMSIFLAFAVTFPDVQVLLMFVIPIKVKWMGVVYGVMMLWYFLTWGTFARFAIAASLLNFLVFFLGTKSWMHLSPKQMKRRAQFKQQVKQNPNPGITRHKCAICGRTEQDDPSLEFRFCSKCNGNYEFCQYHLFTHEHFK